MDCTNTTPEARKMLKSQQCNDDGPYVKIIISNQNRVTQVKKKGGGDLCRSTFLDLFLSDDFFSKLILFFSSFISQANTKLTKNIPKQKSSPREIVP
jgi:hypothetical protein